ncbi:MAG: hypothetical protein DMD79_00900, partial [Candidatus Rokuibacteriota bacterium]
MGRRVGLARSGSPRYPGLSPTVDARPLRVLEIYPKADFYTGAAIQLRDLARGLVRRGHGVVVVTRRSPRWAEEAQAAGFAHRAFFRGPGDPWGAVRLAALVGVEQIDLVHSHKGGGRTLTLLARVLRPFGPHPPLVTNRGVSFPLAPLSRLVEKSPLVTAVVAVCEAVKADLVRQGVPAEKIEVVYSGTDTDRFDPARVDGAGVRAELGLDPATPLVTQIGVREPKGNDDVLRAFARVHARRPEARLLL